MSVNIYEDKLRRAELFGRDVLYTDQSILRSTVPKNWHCYDLKGTEKRPFTARELVDQTTEYHVGTILSAVPLKRPVSTRQVAGQFFLHGEELTLAEFCEEHGLECPATNRKFALRPASPHEAGYFYAMKPEEDAKRGAIGHVRIDFGHGGKEFWTTWHPRGPEEWNSPEFKSELTEVVDELRKDILKSLKDLTGHCRGLDGKIDGGWVQNYGYIVETENYRYCLRCNPVPGDYQAYLNCFDQRVQELNQGEQKPPRQGMTMGGL